jgi:hypothetical protein
MTSMLWDILVSWESKHIWQMVNETWVDDFVLVSIVDWFSWTRRVWYWISLNQVLKNDSRVHKWENIKQRWNDKGDNVEWI